ncbi:MAG: Aminotransferase, classes I and II [Clostridiales bacterium 38_11]|nr:MAG: Aminotransferase, classes I and II [Clostridiales bacterium 38_11]HBH13768.1 cystathionine beta-lyase [Clostridiales bacterium]
MKYDFDTFVDRDNTNSIKWNYAKEYVGVEDVLPMWVADMDFETAPEIKQAIIDRAKHGIYGYTKRSEGYYQSVIDWSQKRFNWKIEKSWITHSSGVVNALFTTLRALTDQNDGVMIQPPVYHPFYRAIETCGCRLVLNPLEIVNGRFVVNLEDFEKKLIEEKVKIFVLCNPHNPTGRVFKMDELTAMGELCIKHNVLVISDEIHADLVYKRYRHIPFASISEEFANNSITCTAPSKTFNLAGLYTSNIIIPNESFMKKYQDSCEKADINSFNIFGAIACEAGYRFGEEWLEQLMDYIESNKNFVTGYIRERLPQLKVFEPEGTYLMWLDCNDLGMTKEQLEQFMVEKARLWVNQGHIFGKEGEGFVRMNLACQRATVIEAMTRLEAAIKNL